MINVFLIESKMKMTALVCLQSQLIGVNLTVTCSQQQAERMKFNHKFPGVSKGTSRTGDLVEDTENLCNATGRFLQLLSMGERQATPTTSTASVTSHNGKKV
jgi:hypothetical protein